MPRTKIVATLGPACDPPGRIAELIAAGVGVFRLNASHGTQEQRGSRIQVVRKAAADAGTQIALLLDLQGPKIRLGKFEGGTCCLETGQRFCITVQPVLGDREIASTGYEKFAEDVRPGDRVLLADGTVELKAVANDGTAVIFDVVEGGEVGDNKGINLPGVKVSAPSLTPKDVLDLKFGLAAGVDLVALSFVRTAADMRSLKALMVDHPKVRVIAKIEKPEACSNLGEILRETHGVMVARGDLGVEMALEAVPAIQKMIIREARRNGRFVITATQMLESMIHSATPTRAEVSDVANAIYDGTDAVMLSAETSVGKFPVQTVQYMARIAAEAERSLGTPNYSDFVHGPAPKTAEILADAAFQAARSAHVAAVVVFTSGGYSARLISRYHPPVPIYAITTDEAVARTLAVNYGATSLLAPPVSSTDEMLHQMDLLLRAKGLLKSGDTVVFVAGQPIGRSGTTNMMKIHQLGT